MLPVVLTPPKEAPKGRILGDIDQMGFVSEAGSKADRRQALPMISVYGDENRVSLHDLHATIFRRSGSTHSTYPPLFPAGRLYSSGTKDIPAQ